MLSTQKITIDYFIGLLFQALLDFFQHNINAIFEKQSLIFFFIGKHSNDSFCIDMLIYEKMMSIKKSCT